MKQMGFTLKEIKEYMKDYTLDKSIHAMRRQMLVIDAKIKELNIIRSRIAHRSENMEQAKNGANNECVIDNQNEQFLLIKEVAKPYSFKDISIATKGCFTYAFKCELPIYFECGVVVPMTKIRNKHYTQAKQAFVLTDQELSDENIVILPAGKVVYTYHIGTYETIGVSYDRLLAYYDNNDLEIISDAFEFCLNDYLSTNQEQEFITKIMIYIKNKERGCCK